MHLNISVPVPQILGAINAIPQEYTSNRIVGQGFCLVLSCLVLSCLVLSCLVLSCRVVSCRVVSCRVVSCLVLSCLCKWFGFSRKDFFGIFFKVLSFVLFFACDSFFLQVFFFAKGFVFVFCQWFVFVRKCFVLFWFVLFCFFFQFFFTRGFVCVFCQRFSVQ